MNHAGWLWQMMDPSKFERLCRKTERALAKLQPKLGFDAVAFTGLSGSLLAPAIARSLKLHMVAVRPPGNYSHSIRMVECKNAESAIILDDFIESGKTVRRILRHVKKEHPYINISGVLLHESETRGFNGTRYNVGKLNLPVFHLHKMVKR